MPDEYDPASIRVLAGLEPRPQGELVGIEPEYWWATVDGIGPVPVAVWRDAGDCEDPPRPWGAERLGVEGVLWPDRVRLIARALPPGGRLALPVEDLSDAEMAAIMAARPIGPDYSLDDLPGVDGGLSAAREREQAYAESVYRPDPAELTPAYREAWGRGLTRCPVEDGPGSGQRVELSVRVLVGLERSTVIVADPITGRALTREVLPHGREADVAAAAVEAALRARLPGDPGDVPGAVRESAGEPRE